MPFQVSRGSRVLVELGKVLDQGQRRCAIFCTIRGQDCTTQPPGQVDGLFIGHRRGLRRLSCGQLENHQTFEQRVDDRRKEDVLDVD